MKYKFDPEKCLEAEQKSWQHKAAFLSFVLPVFSFPLWVIIDFMFFKGHGNALIGWMIAIFLGILFMLTFDHLSWRYCKNCHGKSKREYMTGGDTYMT